MSISPESVSLANATLAALSRKWEIPDHVKDAAWSARLADGRESSAVSDHFLGNGIDMGMVVCLADQLFRHRVCEDLLGVILTGTVGQILAGGMIAAIGKKRRKSGAENITSHTRTSFSVARNLFTELESIRSIAIGILFNSETRLQLCLPVQYDGVLNPNADLAGPRHHVFTCHDTMSGEYVKMAAKMVPAELALLKDVIGHNCQNDSDPSVWQFVMMTTRQNDSVTRKAEENGHILENENIWTIRRIKKSLEAKITNNVIAAFGAAAFRYYLIEFGHDTEFRELTAEHRDMKFSHQNAEFVPALYVDTLRQDATPLQNRILDVVGLEFSTTSGKDVLDVLRTTMVTPPSRATFFRQWKELMVRTREMMKSDRD